MRYTQSTGQPPMTRYPSSYCALSARSGRGMQRSTSGGRAGAAAHGRATRRRSVLMGEAGATGRAPSRRPGARAAKAARAHGHRAQLLGGEAAAGRATAASILPLLWRRPGARASPLPGLATPRDARRHPTGRSALLSHRQVPRAHLCSHVSPGAYPGPPRMLNYIRVRADTLHTHVDGEAQGS